jgi:hypothetical protein
MTTKAASPRNITKLMKNPITKTRRIKMRFAKVLRVSMIAVGIVGGSGSTPVVDAAVVTTSQPTSPSTTEPVWGQGLTINVGASLPDASIPATVMLNFVGWRTGTNTIGSPDRSAVYLHVYDDFGITAGGAVDGTAIGTLVAVSTNTVNLETPAVSTDVFWYFADPSLAKNVTYHYIMASNTVAATSGDFGNLIYSDFVVATGNPHAGGQAYRQPGDTPASDLYFRVQSSFSPIPEPSTFLLLLGGSWLAWRCRMKGRAT